MQVSVLVSHYNQPESLRRCLLSLQVQDDRNFEVLVADDGSDETALTMLRSSLQKILPFTLLTHPRQGWQKSFLLNKAVRASRGDYLVFVDGDCLLRRDFVASHRRLARPGHYLSGHRLNLSEAAQARLRDEDILAGRVFDPPCFASLDPTNGKRQLRLACPPWLCPVLDRLTHRPRTLSGSNASLWREDFLRVNG